MQGNSDNTDTGEMMGKLAKLIEKKIKIQRSYPEVGQFWMLANPSELENNIMELVEEMVTNIFKNIKQEVVFDNIEEDMIKGIITRNCKTYLT